MILTFPAGRIYFAERTLASSKSEVIDALNRAIDLKDEGVMIKRPNSIYKPGVRTRYVPRNLHTS